MRSAASPEQTPKQSSARNRPPKDGTEGHADKRSADRQAAKAAVTVVSSQEVPPGFGSARSASQPAEERRRPAIGIIRTLVASHTDVLPRHDKVTSTKPAAAKDKPAAELNVPAEDGSQTVKPSRRRERKERQAEAAAAGAPPAAATAGKQGSAAMDAPPGIVARLEPPLSSKQKKRVQRDQPRESALQKGEETSPSDLHEMPPGLDIPEPSSKAPAQVAGAAQDRAAPRAKEAGKGKAVAQVSDAGKDKSSHSSASRAFKQALGPAYFERPVKQQQEQTAKSAESAAAVDDKSPAAVADSKTLAADLTDGTAAGDAESAVLPSGPPSMPEQPPERAALDGKFIEDKAATTSEVTTFPSELQEFPLLVLPGPILQPKRPPETCKLVKPDEHKPPAGPVKLGQKGKRLPRKPLGDVVAKMPWVEAPVAGGTPAAAVEGSWGPGEAQERGNTAWSEAAQEATGSRPSAQGFKRYWSSSEVSAQQKVSADEGTPVQSPRVDGTGGEAVSVKPHRNARRRGQDAAAHMEAEDPGEGSESGWGEPHRDANWDAAASGGLAGLVMEPAGKSGPGGSREGDTADSESRPAAAAGEAAPQDTVAELDLQNSPLQEDTSIEVTLEDLCMLLCNICSGAYHDVHS